MWQSYEEKEKMMNTIPEGRYSWQRGSKMGLWKGTQMASKVLVIV